MAGIEGEPLDVEEVAVQPGPLLNSALAIRGEVHLTPRRRRPTSDLGESRLGGRLLAAGRGKSP